MRTADSPARPRQCPGEVVDDNPAVGAGGLEFVPGVRTRLAALLGRRPDQLPAADPRPAGVAGAALSGPIAATGIQIFNDRQQPSSDLLDQAMSAVKPA